MKKIFVSLLCAVLLLGMFSACGTEAASSAPAASVPAAEPEASAEEETPYQSVDLSVGTIKGPTGVGMVKLMDDAAKGLTANNYNFTLEADASEVVTKVIAGEYDIGCLPTNSAAMIYQKTGGKVKLLALNTAGVLYILQNTEKGAAITDWSELKGKTIYTLGQSANPEYVLDYVLKGHGIDPDKDVEIVFCSAADEVIAACVSGEADFCMLPEPSVSALKAKAANFETVFDMTEGWDEVVSDGSILTQGCVVVQTAFLEEHPEAVKKFLEEYEASIQYVLDHMDTAPAMLAQYEIVPSEGIAKAALPGCHLIFMAGQEMKDSIAGYYQVLFDADATAVGGKVPDDEFYAILE